MQTEDIQPQLFHIKSTVRSVHTRTQRYAAPVAIRRVQFILDTQQRLVPGRSLVVTEEDIQRNVEHLKGLEALGICVVHSQDGRKLDLETFQLAGSQPESPAPKFREDSVENDHSWQAKPKVEGEPVEEVQPETPMAFAGVDLGVPGEPMLANPDFAPSRDPEPVEEIEQEVVAVASPKKNKRR